MAEFIKEASDNLCKDNLPAYYKYRYTFPDDFDLHERKVRFNLIFNHIKSKFALGNVIGGMEEYTKGMITTKPHCHIHFVSKHNSDTIRKSIMREFKLIGRCQACKAEVIVDEPKFWRYPLKQQLNDTRRCVLTFGFNEEWIQVQTEIAYACWKQSAEIAIAKVEKKLEKTSKERLFVYLDSLDFAFKNIKQVCCYAYQYFTENEDTVCVKTIDGYVNIYLLQKNYLSYDEFFDLTH